jgi:hypothetical protein
MLSIEMESLSQLLITLFTFKFIWLRRSLYGQFRINAYRIIEKNLQGMSGLAFEEHARFLLKLIDSRYTFTRLYKDKGIDGYIRNTIKQNKKKIIVIEIFSIYGKEAWTRLDEGEISKDLIKASNYAEEKGYLFKKWSLVLNFELNTDIKTKLEDVCEKQGIYFEEINPTVLITKLNGSDKIFDAACYFNAVKTPKLPYSSFSYHELAKQALIDISKKQHSNTDEQLDLIKDLVTTILKFSFLGKKGDLSHLRYSPIAGNTRIHPDFIIN